MTRHHRYYKTPPHRRPPRTAPAFPRSPIVSKVRLTNRSGFQTRSTNTNRHLPHRAKLGAIIEEQEDIDPWQTRDLYRQLDVYGDGSEINSQYEDDMIPCDDDETTLVAMLEDKDYEQRDSDALIDELKTAMASCVPSMKRYLANTLIPTSSSLREAHTVLENDVDIRFGTGILAFDELSKKVEALVLQDEDDTKNIIQDSKKKVDIVLERLDAAKAVRDQIWTNFEQNMNELLERATNVLQSAPKHIEQTISHLEKKSKEFEKDDDKLRALLLQKRPI